MDADKHSMPYWWGYIIILKEMAYILPLYMLTALYVFHRDLWDDMILRLGMPKESFAFVAVAIFILLFYITLGLVVRLKADPNLKQE